MPADTAVRLDRFLSENAGLTRSQARKAIAAGRVCVGGAVCKKADAKLAPGTPATLDGRALAARGRNVYLMLNKPAGVLCVSRDAHAATVTDLVGPGYGRHSLFPAGRLDKASTGLVLLTDDGALAHGLLAPGRHVEKAYLVQLDTPLTAAMQAGFAAGVTLADGTRLAPADVCAAGGDACTVRVTLRQGVYHQIKRMFGMFGAGVNALHRVSIGPLTLDPALAPGAWRELGPAELAALRAAAGLPQA